MLCLAGETSGIMPLGLGNGLKKKKKTNRREFRGQQYKLLGMWNKNIKGKKKLRQHSDTGLKILNKM